MREYKTLECDMPSDLDNEVNKAVSEGWEVDSRQVVPRPGHNPQIFAFISRPLPEKRFDPDEPPLNGWPFARVDAAMRAITEVVVHPRITGSIKELRESLAELQGKFTEPGGKP